jgi:sirohydrochlorin cobaltochelatase
MKHVLALFLAFFVFTGVAQASGDEEVMETKTAIVISSFGSSYENTLESILALVEEVKAKYPETPVKLAFTSNIIRKIWHERAEDEEYKKAHPSIPAEIYNVQNVLGAIAELQNRDYRNIVVQPTLFVEGEEYKDVLTYVNALASIKTIKPRLQPFKALAVGEPLMGSYHHMEQMEALAVALEKDAILAKKEKAALVYMGHGNEHMSQGAYYELELLMKRKYGIPVAIGLVEGLPDLEAVIDELKDKKVKKVILKPLMYVAGDHAVNDMASDEEDSWKTLLTEAGFKVQTVLEGLGEKPEVRAIFINHLEEAANGAGIVLK